MDWAGWAEMENVLYTLMVGPAKIYQLALNLKNLGWATAQVSPPLHTPLVIGTWETKPNLLN